MKKNVYLAGAFEENEYRFFCKKYYSDVFNLIDPINDSSKDILKDNNIEMNQETGKLYIPPEVGQVIVDTDKDLIDSCYFIVAYVNRPSFGTAMEICYAHENHIPVFTINPNQQCKDDVWLRYHSTKIFESIEECFEWLKKYY